MSDKLHCIIPQDFQVTILADQGFTDTRLFEYIRSIGFHYRICIREIFKIESTEGESQQVFVWVSLNARNKSLMGTRLTKRKFPVENVLLT